MKRRAQECCLDAVTALLKAKDRIEIAELKRPDEVDRTTKNIDRLLVCSEQSVALEHTVCESFPRQLEAEALFKTACYEHFHDDAFLGRLNERLGAGVRVELFYPAHVIRSGRDIKRVIRSIKDWVLETAPALVMQTGPRIRATTIHHGNSKLWVKFAISNSQCARHIEFVVIPIYQDNEREDYQAVIQYAFEHGTAKLRRYKQDGCKTVLVLEHRPAFASPYMPIFHAACLLSRHYYNELDMVACLRIEDDLCSILFAERGETDERLMLKNSWCLYHMKENAIRQRKWEEGILATALH